MDIELRGQWVLFMGLRYHLSVQSLINYSLQLHVKTQEGMLQQKQKHCETFDGFIIIQARAHLLPRIHYACLLFLPSTQRLIQCISSLFLYSSSGEIFQTEIEELLIVNNNSTIIRMFNWPVLAWHQFLQCYCDQTLASIKLKPDMLLPHHNGVQFISTI